MDFLFDEILCIPNGVQSISVENGKFEYVPKNLMKDKKYDSHCNELANWSNEIHS